jgi:hypothetical protein
VPAPILTVALETCSAVEVESWPTTSSSVGLVDPATLEMFDGELGAKTAVSCSGDTDAENDVWHVTIEGCPSTGKPAHPLTGVPRLLIVMVPCGVATLGDEKLDTLALKLTSWLVTGALGIIVSAVELPIRVTTDDGAELAGLLVPPAFVADSCNTIVFPTSAWVSR